MLVGSLGYTDVKLLGYDEGIKLRYTDGKVVGNILGNVDRITLWALYWNRAGLFRWIL